jgi:hypothetical protein
MARFRMVLAPKEPWVKPWVFSPVSASNPDTGWKPTTRRCRVAQAFQPVSGFATGNSLEIVGVVPRLATT